MSEIGSSFGKPPQHEEDEEFWPAPRRRAREERSRRARRNRVIIGACIGAILLGLALIVVVPRFIGDDGGESSDPKPTSYVPTPADSKMAKLDQRSADQRPLAKTEVFSDDVKAINQGNFSFDLTASDLTDDCDGAVWGESLRNSLQNQKCTQIARGMYVTRDKKFAGMIVAINLEQRSGAEQIQNELAPENDAGFVQPLSSKGVSGFGEGFSAAYAQPFGHYLVLSWVQRADGGKPGSMQEMTTASVAIESAANFLWLRLQLAGG